MANPIATIYIDLGERGFKVIARGREYYAGDFEGLIMILNNTITTDGPLGKFKINTDSIKPIPFAEHKPA